jgi:hypothetical protein
MEQPWIDSWPMHDEPLSKVAAPLDVETAAAGEAVQCPNAGDTRRDPRARDRAGLGAAPIAARTLRCARSRFTGPPRTARRTA